MPKVMAPSGVIDCSIRKYGNQFDAPSVKKGPSGRPLQCGRRLLSVPMKTPSTAKTILNVRESPTRCPAPDAHLRAAKSESACATSALIRAAAAMHEAATCIAGLEARIGHLEALMASFGSAPPPADQIPTAAPSPPSIDAENRSHVDTSKAAGWLNRKPQTLRTWACHENGPLRPVRINGRLAWAVADIRRVLASTR